MIQIDANILFDCLLISDGVSRPIFSSLGLECLRSRLGLEGLRSRYRALSLETLHELFFFMKSYEKQLLENGVVKELL